MENQDLEYSKQDLVMELVSSDNPILREETPKFDFGNPPIDPIKLAHILAQSCLKHDGLGLSSPQIGLPYRAFIIKAKPMICMFNPEIVAESDDEVYGEEGCLTFPNLIIKIKRPEVVRVRFAQPNGEIYTKQYEGLTARCIQHELDHLDGILFMDRATDLHYEQAKKRKKKIIRASRRKVFDSG